MTKTQKILWPLAAILVGLLVAVTTPRGPKIAPSTERQSSPTKQHDPRQPTPTMADAPTLEGTVLETISVPNYVYLRLSTADGTEQWAAVNAAEIRVGQRVKIRDAQLMEKFTSNTLKRTFERIHFGALVTTDEKPGSGVANSTPNPHGALEVPSTDGEQSPQAVPGANPHADPMAVGDNVSVGQVAKATGTLGKTVAEVFANAPRLAGKVVRLRGVVVKATPKVMGRTFLHLRDGSGSKATDDFDLAVTTTAVPAVGTTVLLEGTVKTDVDFGSGYRYRVLLEDAREVTD